MRARLPPLTPRARSAPRPGSGPRDGRRAGCFEQGYRWGCDGYVTQPFEPDHLLAEVGRLLESAQTRKVEG